MSHGLVIALLIIFFIFDGPQHVYRLIRLMMEYRQQTLQHRENMAKIEHAREMLLLYGKDVGQEDSELTDKILAAYERAEKQREIVKSDEKEKTADDPG